MNMKDIKKIAKKAGIKELNMKKDDLIRSIQRAEGNIDCFGTPSAERCSQADCLWREDCMS